MKFKDKDGNVFEDIHSALQSACPSNNGKQCGKNCPLWKTDCYYFWQNCPTEAARLMGYEVVEEEDAEFKAHRELLDAMYDKNRKSNIEFSASIQKEANMDKQKPLEQWTLGEVQEYCSRQSKCKECELVRGPCCVLAGPAARWDLTNPPRFTEEEVAVIRYIDNALHINEIRRTNDGILEVLFAEDGLWAFPAPMFPSIRPGQPVKLSEIVGGAK